MIRIIIFFHFLLGTFSAHANLICDLPDQSTCTEILDVTNDQLVHEVEQICQQNKGHLDEGVCSNENAIGYCQFHMPLITKYYAPEYNDYGAEMTCNYSRGKYRRLKM